MSNSVTIIDVANRAGVSGTTASLTFKDSPRISAATKRQVLKAAEELNYVPNLAARQLRNGLTNSVAFIVNDIRNPFYNLMLQEAEARAEEAEFNVIFGSSNWSADKERRLVGQMIQARVRGVIICLCEKNTDISKMLREANVPHIAVDSRPNWHDGPFVSNDFRAAATLAAEHLHEVGCERPAYFNAGGDMNGFSAFAETLRHFSDHCRSLRMAFGDHSILEAGLDIESGKRAALNAVKVGVKFDGAFCANDLCALGVIEGLRLAGRDPATTAVMGIDDIETSSLASVSLTSIRQPYADIARLATEALLNSFESGEPPEIRETLPPTLIKRNSTLGKGNKRLRKYHNNLKRG